MREVDEERARRRGEDGEEIAGEREREREERERTGRGEREGEEYVGKRER